MGSRGVWASMSARSKRWITVSWTALFILSLLLQYMQLASPPTTLGASVPPTDPGPGNPTCADLGYDLSFKIDTGALENKTYSAGDSHVQTNWSGQSITISNLSADNQTFDWSSTLPVDVVIVKAGVDNHSVYTYAPPSTGDTELTHGLDQQGNSHEQFCGKTRPPEQPDTPRIEVTKFANPWGPVSAGEEIGFDITVSSTGDVPATGIHVTDELDPNFTWVLAPNTADDCSITGAVGSQVLVCNDSSLAPGEFFSVHVSAETDAESCGKVYNAVFATSDNAPAAEAMADVYIVCADVAVTKKADASPIVLGDTAGFTIGVSNIGKGDAYNVHVEDDLPGDIDWTIDPAVSGCSITGSKLTCDFEEIEAGESLDIHVTGSTEGAECETLHNVVTVSADDEPASAGQNNSASADIDVACSEVSISKTADHQAPVELGSEIGFTVTVRNLGNTTASDLHVTDALDSRYSWTIESQSGALTWTLVGNQLSASGDLPPGTSSAHVVATTPTTNTENFCGPVPNTAFLTQGSGEFTEDLGSASASENVLCAEIGEFNPSGECDANTPYLVYDVPVLNLPSATSVTITFVNPGGPDIVFADQPLSGKILWPGAVLNASGEIIDWPGWTLQPDGTWVEGDEFSWTRPTVQILFEVNPSATVTVDYPPATTACADPPPNLGIVKSNNAPIETVQGTDGPVDVPVAKVGDTITYTLTYNTNGVAQHNGVITDVLPDGITYVANSATDSDEFEFVSYTSATRTLRWEADEVTKGGSVTYKVTIDTDAAELSQPLINVATIDTDEQPADDDQSPVYVGVKPLAITAPPTDTLAPVATPSNPGFALMLVLLAIAAFALAIGFITPVPEHVRRNRPG